MDYRQSHLKLYRKLCQLLGWVFLFLLDRCWVRLRPGNIPEHTTLGKLPILYTWELATASHLPAPWEVMPLNHNVTLDIGVFMTQ
jgi:hypothetical protein